MNLVAPITRGGTHASPIPSHGAAAGIAMRGNGTFVEHGTHNNIVSRSLAAVGSVLRRTLPTF
jgi:hypothetical protein